MKKANFYGLFKPAYASAFTKKTIEAAFEATSIWPKDRTKVTQKFQYITPPLQTDNIGLSHLSPANWKRTQRLLEQVIKDNSEELLKKLEGAIHRASTHTKLLELENVGLIASLDTKNKRTKHGRRLLLGGKKKQPTDAVFYSPKKLKEARAEQARKDEAKAATKAAKYTAKELSKAKKALSEKLKNDKRIEAERLAAVKDKDGPGKAASKGPKKNTSNTSKAVQTTQTGKRKALKALSKPKKRQKKQGGFGVESGSSHGVERAASPLLTRTTKSGRNVTLPSKFR